MIEGNFKEHLSVVSDEYKVCLSYRIKICYADA